MLVKGATYREYLMKTELIKKEDLTEGKLVERLYEMNMIDAAENPVKGVIG